jgi:hypothetical protein
MRREEDEYLPKDKLKCPQCDKEFKPIKNFQIFCHAYCEDKYNVKAKQIEEKRLTTECTLCRRKIRKPNESSRGCICETCKFSKKRESNEIVRIRRLKERAEIREKQPSKKKKISYDELNRRAEYKRVFDDSGWDHYLKGRKWDRI